MQQQAPDPRLREALGLHQAGQLGQAEAAYQKILDTDPNQVDALQLMGVLFGQTRRLDQAHNMLSRAATARPEDANIKYNLGECCRQLGRTGDALDAYRAALTMAPDHADAAAGLAGLLLQEEEADEAIEVCRKILKRVPKDPRLHNQLGCAQLDSGDVVGARKRFQKAIELAPNDSTARRNLAVALVRLDEMPQALELLDALIKDEQDSVDLLYLAALALNRVGQYADALPLLERILKLEPDNVGAIAAMARAHRNLLQTDKAIACYQRTVELAPHDARQWALWAEMLTRISRLNEAREAQARAKSFDPNDEIAALVGAQLARRDGDNDTAYAELKPLASSKIDRRFRAGARYELGGVCEAMGRYDEAFQAYSDGNADRAHTWGVSSLDPKFYPRFIKGIYEYISDDTLVSRLASWSDLTPKDRLPTPYFLVGFPRSGTTLIERLLDSHPDIATTSELPIVNAMVKTLDGQTGGTGAYPAALDNLDEDALRRLRQSYWDYLRDKHADLVDNRQVIDKLPLNLVHLGLIFRAFPDARVLVALRDPRDVCISCFANNFLPNRATVQFLDLERTARTYAAVMALWQRYRKVLPLQTYAYRYEDLVASPREVLGQIVEFLGVPWHDELLEGGRDSVGTYISTPSYVSVVEPINTRAVARWQNYASNLAPVLPLLDPFIEDFGYGDAPATEG